MSIAQLVRGCRVGTKVQSSNLGSGGSLCAPGHGLQSAGSFSHHDLHPPPGVGQFDGGLRARDFVFFGTKLVE